jgi:O-antigen/teichoic acid export membrane protein
MSVARIAGNIGAGLVSQAWTVLVGLVVLPILVRGLGADRYGGLAICLAMVGFASFADLGVGRAISRFVAEEDQRGRGDRIQMFVSTALSISLPLATIGTAALFGLGPVIATKVLHVKPALVPEIELAFKATALGIFPTICSILLQAVFVGFQRIYVLSFATAASNTIKAGLSVAAIYTGYGLVGVVVANVAISWMQALFFWVYTEGSFPFLKVKPGWDRSAANQLLRLGPAIILTWIAVTALFMYADRFIIAAFLPVALVGYYAAAFDITSKQCYIANSIQQAFFPAFSAAAAAGEAALEKRYVQAMKLLAVAATGLAALLIALGRPLLAYWISPEFGARSAAVMVALTIGVLFSSYVCIPYASILGASDSPNASVKIFLFGTALHVTGSLLLVRRVGIVGVGLAYATAYCVVWLVCQRWVSRNLVRVPLTSLARRCFLGAWITALFTGSLWFIIVRPLIHNLWQVLLAFALGYPFYLLCAAMVAYDNDERGAVLQYIGTQFRRRAAGLPAVSPTEP